MKAHLSLGSNLDPGRNMVLAVRRIAALGRVASVSSVYQSPPQGGAAGPDFLNAALVLETELDAETLKARLRGIERDLGRGACDPANAPRTIDIDIILHDNAPPHPDLTRYAHVAVPLAEIAPGVVHPDRGEPVSQIAERLGRSARLERRADVCLRL